MTAHTHPSRLAWRLGWVLWVLFVAVMAAGADHPPPLRFWLLPVASLLLVPAAGWLLPVIASLWGRRGWLTGACAALVTGALVAAVLWTVFGVLSGHLVGPDPAATVIGYFVVAVTGASAWLLMVAIVVRSGRAAR